MATCTFTGCNAQIKEGYQYCYTHFSMEKGKGAPEAAKPAKAWHDDPVVDALLKLNANVGRLAKATEEVRDLLETKR